MSQRTSRRTRPAKPGGKNASPPRPAAQPRVEIKGDPAFFRRINYRAVGLGFLVAMAVYLVVGYLVQSFLIGARDSTDTQNGIYSSVGFLALFCGGLAAGMVEPKYGVLNGPLVAVGFILVAYVLTFSNELQLVKRVGPLGLGPMRVDRVFATDLPQLFFSSLGGFVAGIISRRGVTPGPKP
ncbi:MAG: YrzE family protein [Candidatus Dormibacteria bacterium]